MNGMNWAARWAGLITVAVGWLAALSLRGDDWPQWLGPQRDGVWRETGTLDTFPPDGPAVRWRVPVGPGYSGPAVAQGRVYLTDRQPAPDATPPANAFNRGFIPGQERVLCLDESTGNTIWSHAYDCPYDVSYPAGPRATPVIDEDRVYTLGTEGNLNCFDAATGQVRWSKAFKEEYGVTSPTWGFAAHPLVDGDMIYCLARGKGTTVVACDKRTGEERWRALSASEPGYCPPMIYTFHGRRQLIVWHPESINALDPRTGDVQWSFPFKVRSGLTVATPRQQGDRLLVSCFYNGAKVLEIAPDGRSVDVVWEGHSNSERNTETLHTIMSTPVWAGDHIYGVGSYGQLRCLNALTGERIWESFDATTDGEPARWANAFLVPHHDRYLIANEKGDLILATLSARGYTEHSRAHILEPTNRDPGRLVVWSHPALANRCAFMRNDEELVCVSLESPAAGGSQP
jgi:outer membrane protein assembly factor BamB